jgi:hypothetical protein
MKINYFGYCFKSPNNDRKVLFDMRNFLRAYSRLKNPDFKNTFMHQDEHVYLLHHTADIYLFIITRSNELIRKVNTEDLTVGEIHSLLADNEQLGFASYVIVKENCFGFGSTLLAPKVDIFSHYLNSLLECLGIVDWRFVPQALLYQATKAEALEMSFIGKTTIELSKNNSFVQDILAAISADTTDTIDLEGIEIIIKPKIRKNIKETVNKFLDHIPDDGVQKMIMKAKGEGLSQMTDLYLVGRGAISDSIDRSKNSKISINMEDKLVNNRFLTQKITEYIGDEEFEENSLNAIVRYHDANAWATFISNIQQSNRVEP